MISSADFEVKIRAVERAHGTVDVHEYFPELIAEMLERTADSLNVPRAFMISGVLQLPTISTSIRPASR
jgi:hypothetical protein